MRVPDTSTYNYIGSFTVSAWVYPDTVSQPNGAGLVVRGSGTLENFALDVSGGLYRFLPHPTKVAASTTSLAAGAWIHLIGVYDAAAASATLYVNGQPASTVLTVPARRADAHDISIGNRQSGSTTYDKGFQGRIDSVRILHRALSAAQALAEYQGNFVSTVTPASPNQNILIGLPPNAFSAPATMLVSADPVGHPISIPGATLNAGLSAVPTGFTLVANSIVEIVPIVAGAPFTSTLGSSATISFPYNDANRDNIIDGSNPPLAASAIQVYTLNTTINRWERLPSVLDAANTRVIAWTPHFSVFALFAPYSVGTSLSQVRAYPVPWKPGSRDRFDAAGVTFDQLPASGSLRILSLAGERVRQISFNGASAGTVIWDGLNDSGRRAASGVYFARVLADDGSTAVLKFAIER
ncbi:MAG: hypothetical protein HYZ74_07655 [Elusimicrobia bacterium]|nr:hypothetical protein [Elusimicrobiota bacterium]